MSNDSLHSLPWFSGDSYNRVLAATPPEDSPPDFFYVPEKTFVIVNRPLPRPITPRPITPRPITPAFDFSQDGQRIGFSQWSPPALRNTPFRYSEMTQSRDSGCFTYQTSPPPHSLSPDMFSTPTTPMSNIILPPEIDLLIFGSILNTSQPSQNETKILAIHMLENEGEWYNDGADEVLNHHMDVYEFCEGEF